MSNEISTSINVNVTNGSYKGSANESASFNQSAIGAVGGVVSVATSATTIPQTGVTTAGWLYLKNVEPAGGNYLDYGPDSSGQVNFGRLKAGEFALLRLTPSIVMKATAHTAACNLVYMLWSD